MSQMTEPISESSTSRRLQIGDTDVHYHDVGSGEPLLMLPSYGPRPGVTAWLTFGKVVESFASRYRCIVMDLPNYGRTGPVVYNAPLHDFFAEVAVGLMHELGYESWNAVGSSQGGQVCCDMALLFPGTVKSIVCGGSHISTGGDKYLLGNFPSEGIRLAIEAESDPTNPEKLRRFLNALVYDPTLITDELFNQIFEMRTTRQDFWDAIHATPNIQKNNIGAIAQIDVPTLIVHGRFDRIVPYEQGLAILSYVRSAQLVVLNRCGHWAPFERPDDFSSHVLRFLDSIAD
jgi:pimeloyl-ACP methyl ester carboxylesterase